MDKLSEEELALLQRYGAVRPTSAGEVLYREGEPPPGLMVVLAGLVATIDHIRGVEREVSVYGRGGAVGLVATVTGERAYLSAVVREAGSLLVIATDHLRELLALDEPLGDAILQLLFRRREWLRGKGAGVRIVGSRYSPDTHRLREFAVRNRVAHVWIELERHPEADAWLMRLGIQPQETPVVLLGGGKVLRNPGNADLARAIGMRGGDPPDAQTACDVAVVGAGPAGLAAAVYGASNSLSTVVLEAVAGRGQAGTAARIENYLGFPGGLAGAEFAERALIQAEKFGARLAIPRRAVTLSEHDGHHVLGLEDGDRLRARTVIIASGVTYRRLAVPHLGDYEGIGVAYTVAATEEQLAPAGNAVVVGGANSAGQAALSIAEQGHHVYLVVRAGGIGKAMARYLIDRIERQPAIDVLLYSEIREVAGARALEQVTVENTRDGTRRTLQAAAMCILIGAEPNTRWLADDLREAHPWNALDRDPYLLETSRPGVFAAGDVRSGSVARVATAAGEGSMAVRFAQEYLLAKGSTTRNS